MYAVIKTGGKQYKVAEGDFLKVEKLDSAVEKAKVEAVVVLDGTGVNRDKKVS